MMSEPVLASSPKLWVRREGIVATSLIFQPYPPYLLKLLNYNKLQRASCRVRAPRAGRAGKNRHEFSWKLPMIDVRWPILDAVLAVEPRAQLGQGWERDPATRITFPRFAAPIIFERPRHDD
jgi:hypothetical protein